MGVYYPMLDINELLPGHRGSCRQIRHHQRGLRQCAQPQTVRRPRRLCDGARARNEPGEIGSKWLALGNLGGWCGFKKTKMMEFLGFRRWCWPGNPSEMGFVETVGDQQRTVLINSIHFFFSSIFSRITFAFLKHKWGMNGNIFKYRFTRLSFLYISSGIRSNGSIWDLCAIFLATNWNYSLNYWLTHKLLPILSAASSIMLAFCSSE